MELVTGLLEGNNISVKPRNPPPPDVEILRRSNILKFIDQAPAKRFEELSKFIDTSGVENSENSLRASIKDQMEELDEAVRSFTQATEELENHWETQGSPEKEARKWAAGIRRKNVGELEASLDLVKKALAGLADVKRTSIELEGTQEKFDAATEKVEAARNLLEEAKKGTNKGNDKLVELLEKTEVYLEGEPEANTCPVCLREKPREELIREIKERLLAMNDLVHATKNLNTEEKVLAAQRSLLQTGKTNHAEKIIDAANLFGNGKSKNLIESDGTQKGLDAIVKLDNTDAEHTITTWDGLTSEIENLIVSLEEREKSLQEETNLHDFISTQINTIEEKEKKQQEIQNLIDLLKPMLEVVETERKAVVSMVLEEISKEVKNLYGVVHPEEEIGKVQLFLSPNRRGSLELRANFFGADAIPPQSFYSESHLDTLGLCVFLALAKKYKTENTIVVLDDVVTSVDVIHLERYLQLVEKEAIHFNQIIVTSHHLPWRERFLNHRLPSGNIHFVELGPWSFEAGIRVYSKMLALEELKSVVNAMPIDRQLIASKAGIILESLLEFIARCYGCKVPLRSHSAPTLGELSSSIPSKLRSILRVDHVDTSKKNNDDGVSTINLGDVIQTVSSFSFIRNQVGCHYNSAAGDVSEAEIRQFGDSVISLGDLLICPDGGDLPTKIVSGSYWQTKSGKIRLHPLAMPS